VWVLSRVGRVILAVTVATAVVGAVFIAARGPAGLGTTSVPVAATTLEDPFQPTNPDATIDPHATDPHATDPHATDPHATDPHVTDPHVTADPRASAAQDPSGNPDATPGPVLSARSTPSQLASPSAAPVSSWAGPSDPDTPWLVASTLGAGLMIVGIVAIVVHRRRRVPVVVGVPRAGQLVRPTVTDLGRDPTLVMRWEPRRDAGTQRLVELTP
jgi:hypothetical protein